MLLTFKILIFYFYTSTCHDYIMVQSARYAICHYTNQIYIYKTITGTGYAVLRRHKKGLISFWVENEGIEGDLKIKSFFYHHK